MKRHVAVVVWGALQQPIHQENRPLCAGLALTVQLHHHVPEPTGFVWTAAQIN